LFSVGFATEEELQCVRAFDATQRYLAAADVECFKRRESRYHDNINQ
jgi:hypothetical protein